MHAIDTDALRREHPVAELVASYGIELRRVGAALVSRCPFHQDRGRPNLHVYPSGRWICYRCDQRGDVIGFVQQIENLTFREAAARLDGVLYVRWVCAPRSQTSPLRDILAEPVLQLPPAYVGEVDGALFSRP